MKNKKIQLEKPDAPIHFPGKRAGENVIMLLRRHWIVVFKQVMYFSSLAFIPLLVFVVLKYYFQFTLEVDSALYPILICATSAYYLFIWVFFFNDFIDYHLDIWIVTDQRIVSIEQMGLFNRTVSELNILKVQDVTSEVRGLFSTFFNYGEVHIQSAGSETRFLFRQIPKPNRVAEIIMHAHDIALKQQPQYESPSYTPIPPTNPNQH